MLDIPTLGLNYLNGALRYCAETADSSDLYEDCEALIETCKALVGPTDLKLALTETAENAADHIARERDVQRSLMEVHQVRKMI